MSLRKFISVVERHMLNEARLLLLEDRLAFLHTNFHDLALANLTAGTLRIPSKMLATIKRQPGQDLGEQFINFIISFDPDKKKRNSQWLLTIVLRKQEPVPLEDLEGVDESLKKFAAMQQGRQLPPGKTDINKYRSVSELNAALRGQQQQIVTADETEQAEMLQQAKLVYDGSDAKVLMPLTQAAACYFGRNTEWCTAWGNHTKLGLRHPGRYPTRSNHFATYSKDGPLFIIETKPDNTLFQYHSESNQFKDDQDVELRPEKVKQLLQGHPGIMRAIGEDRFVNQYVRAWGTSFFSQEALLRVDPDFLVGAVKSLANYMHLPEATRVQPPFTAAMLLNRPQIAAELPKSVFTPQAAAALRGATTANTAYPIDLLIQAYSHFSIEEWPTDVIAEAIVSRQLTDAHAQDAIRRMERLFQIGEIVGYKIDASALALRSVTGDTHGPGSVYLLMAGAEIGGFLMQQESSIRLIRLATKSVLPQFAAILNSLGIAPAFGPEMALNAYDIYYDGQKYGPLDEVSKPDVKAGNTVLRRLGKRKMWIAVNNEKPDMTVWMRGTTLSNTHGEVGDPAAFRQLILKYKAKKVTNPETFGVVNTKAGVVADFDSLLRVAKATPDIAYAMDADSNSIVEAARSYNQLTPEQQTALYTVMRADTIKVNTTQTDRIYDIQVPEMVLNFPWVNIILAKAKVITDRELVKRIVAENLRVIAGASKFVASHQHGRFSVSQARPYAKTDMAAIEKLGQQIRQVNDTTADAVAQRQRDPDKFATDLSGRFAAMNAFQRRRSY